MSDNQVRITFQPSGRTAYVLKGTKLIEAGARAGLSINTPCGSSGTCGNCRVQVTTGATAPGSGERTHFSAKERDEGWRLACQTAVQTDSVVLVPETSRLAGSHQIKTDSTESDTTEVSPAVRKVYVELPIPSMEDNTPDLVRLERAIGPFTPHTSVLRHVSRQLRQCDFKGTVVLAGNRLIDFEPGDTTGSCYGIAFDIGTTTLVGLLLDLTNGQEIGVTSQVNPQVAFGDDVLARIQYASKGAHALNKLNQTIVQAIHEMITCLCEQAGIPSHHVYEVTIAGNTTMEHLLCHIDPAPLGQTPFASAYGRGITLEAQSLACPINAQGSLYIFPVIRGFVGGDTVACILATHLAHTSDSVLMIDIGTNGEIVLAHNNQLSAASTAAGPAFEGARIHCGMRASTGAIEKVLLEDDIRLSVIGNVDPVGLCGSALIDLVAELLNKGMISQTGRLLAPQDLPPELPDALKQRVCVDDQGHTEFLLAETATKDRVLRVVLTERDVRELQLAVGAIRAGISIMLKTAGLTSQTLDRVLIAGGFGSFIRRDHAQRIGLLPAHIDHHKIHHVGNASLAGAKLGLLSSGLRAQGEALARQTLHMELAMNLDFQMEFAEAMIFPE